jgi:hypothetical protein
MRRRTEWRNSGPASENSRAHVGIDPRQDHRERLRMLFKEEDFQHIILEQRNPFPDRLRFGQLLIAHVFGDLILTNHVRQQAFHLFGRSGDPVGEAAGELLDQILDFFVADRP